MGGTKVALRLEHDDLSIRESTFRWAEPDGTDAITSGGATRDLELLARHIRELCEPERLTGVGVALPATLDATGTVTAWPGRPGWAGVELRSALSALFGEAEVRCADDGDLAALAEAHEAACPDLLYLGVGTGIGGGIVLNGKPVPGVGRGSCEVGHLIVDRDGPLCDCGRRGCVQAAASGPATLRRAARRRGEEVAFTALREAVRDGKQWAVAALRESGRALATAVAGVCELVRPSLVLIGGGFAAAMPELVAMVAERTTALERPGHPLPPVRAATLGGLSSLHGAVLLARGLPD
ncbi:MULTISPECIES: ROK family protein [Streptomyces violaceusniger group]|uniref:ROK family protein n=2 Tax=Streptomyces rhizosphaericus TaxID=114699 RepID=A0ABN1S6W0_9ACTN|nr:MULTISPECIES: ROK family protein [Streptomyces violaceusniger group]